VHAGVFHGKGQCASIAECLISSAKALLSICTAIAGGRKHGAGKKEGGEGKIFPS